VLVHQAGVPADVAAVHELCDARGIRVVEDAACALGSSVRGTPVGSHSDFVIFSFHPRKTITTGEGGMIMAGSATVAARLRRLREHGMDVSASDRHASSQPTLEQYVETGWNYRMSDLQAAVGLAQVRRLAAVVERRRDLAARYHDRLRTLPGIRVVQDPAYGTTNYQSLWIELPADPRIERDDVLRALADAGVSARRGIMAAHLEPAFAGHPHAPLPITERLTRRTLILPLFHDMTADQQERVVRALAAAIA
jgi:perosamine synthetase